MHTKTKTEIKLFIDERTKTKIFQQTKLSVLYRTCSYTYGITVLSDYVTLYLYARLS